MGAPFHGKNGLLYVSGQEITGANSWSISFDKDSVETPQFGDTWKKSVPGLAGWSGSIGAWDQGDDKILQDAAMANTSVDVLIYPNRSALTTYYNGNAIFSFSQDGSTGSAVGLSADFAGDGDLAVTGFS